MINQLLGVALFLVLVAIYMVAAQVITTTVSKTWGIRPKIVRYTFAFIVFLIFSYLAAYTNVYERFSELTGIQLRKLGGPG